MKIIFLSIVFFLYNLNLSANSLYCEFEEVYQNGDFHQGFLLLKDDNLRYEYFDQSLYTILFLNQRLNQMNKVYLLVMVLFLVTKIKEMILYKRVLLQSL